MKRRKRSPQQPAVLLILCLTAALSLAQRAAQTVRMPRCNLNLNVTLTPSDEVEVSVAFAEPPQDDEPDPMQTRRFVPESEYIIKARSLNSRLGIVRFALGLLPYKLNGKSSDVGRLVQMANQTLGEHDKICAAFYCHLSCQPRSEIPLRWTTQSTDGAACVEVRALVTMEHDDNNWLKASVFLCRRPQPREQVIVFPAAPCCACGSANYLMRFQGAWDPKPEEVGLAVAGAVDAPASQQAWSELLGTTHDDAYSPWEFGGFPSAGVKELCTNGGTSRLEDEIKFFGGKSVLTVIKARDLPLLRRGADQARSAILTVNSTHHLVTFLSRPSTSPGLCVGLSMLDLCQANCTWADDVTVELRLWSAENSAAAPRIAYLSGTANRSLATVWLMRIPPKLDLPASACAAAGAGKV